MIKYREYDFTFAEIFRIFISGMSSSGKTHFTYSLLKSGLFKFDRVYYFHPDFHEKSPVSWTLSQPIIFESGLPTIQEMLSMPQYSTLIFDDLFAEVRDSKDMDYLFRVLSSKQKLNVIVLTQRYFDKGKYSLSIRNSSNYHVLLRNSDERTNQNVGKMMGLSHDVKKAISVNCEKLYPYIFIDKTNEARVRKMCIYTDIFSRYKILIRNAMKVYLISETDFNATFDKLDSELAAVKNADKSSTICETQGADSADTKPTDTGPSDAGPTDTGPTDAGPRSAKRSLGRYSRSRALERQIERVVQKYKKRSKL